MKKLLYIVFGIILFVIILATIKFNFIDVPYAGGQDIYVSLSNKKFKAHRKADYKSIEVFFTDPKTKTKKTFKAYRVNVASGELYESKNQRFTFWSKGDKAFIKVDDEIVIRGSLKHNKNILRY